VHSGVGPGRAATARGRAWRRSPKVAAAPGRPRLGAGRASSAGRRARSHGQGGGGCR
jgi:hypothetical protein